MTKQEREEMKRMSRAALIEAMYSSMDSPSSLNQMYRKLYLELKFTEGIEDHLSRLEKQIKANAEVSSKLARRIWWLDVILAVATVAGVIIAALSYFYN